MIYPKILSILLLSLSLFSECKCNGKHDPDDPVDKLLQEIGIHESTKPEIIKFLKELQKGNKGIATLKDDMGNTSLHKMMNEIGSLTATQLEELFKIMKNNNVDLNAINNDGETPLISFCKEHGYDHNIKTIEVLLENGADPNIKDDNDCSALYYASRDHTKEKVRNLLIEKSDLKKASSNDIEKNFFRTMLKEHISVNSIKKLLKKMGGVANFSTQEKLDISKEISDLYKNASILYSSYDKTEIQKYALELYVKLVAPAY